MIDSLFNLILFSVVVEAITEIIVAAKITDNFPRKFIKLRAHPLLDEDEPPPPVTVGRKIFIFLDDLLSCGYCTSVWVAGIANLFMPQIFSPLLISWIATTMITHRMSNWLHILYSLVKNGRIKTYDILLNLGDKPMEALDKALERERSRSDPSILKPVEVHSLNDIKKLLAGLDPKNNQPHNDIPLSADISVRENDRNVTYNVHTKTRSKSYREMLIEGLSIIKSRIQIVDTVAEEPIEVNGMEMKPPHFGDSVNSSNWIDPLIKQWLGGYRNGILICWNIDDGYIYQYDIFEHKLSRMPHTKV